MARSKQKPSEWGSGKRKLADSNNAFPPRSRIRRDEGNDADGLGQDVDKHDLDSAPSVTISRLPSYEHSSLEGSSCIRLLSINPGTGSEVSCEISHVDLDKAPEYEALSYVWGPPVKACQLVVRKTSTDISPTETSQLLITRSLYRALCHLRFADAGKGSRILWADAICINQEDPEERNAQVQMMGRIYRSASRVVTYIGEKTEHTGRAIELATKLNKYAESHMNEPPDSRLYYPQRLPELGFPPQDDPSWPALIDLMKRPWSSRVWIVQESVLNSNVMMVCGDISFNWSLLGNIALHRAAPAVPSLLPTQLSLEIMGTIRRKVGDLTLLQALRLCRQLSCTEPRDRIYGLLNIAKDINELDITVDYQKPIKDLYTSVAAKMLLAEDSLILLSCASKNSMFSLPSWVPDWSSGQVSDPLGARKCYAASSDSSADITVDLDRKSLSVLGATVDAIAYLTGEITLELAFSDFDINAEWQSSEQQRSGRKWLKEQVSQMSAFPSRYADPMDAFWRTLVGNVASDQKTEADKAYEAAFDAWLRLLYSMERNGNGLADLGPAKPENEPELLLEFLNALAGHWNDRSFCITTSGYFGLVPAQSRIGGPIVILYGGRTPFVLGLGIGHFVLVGDCYVHGLMKGEALSSGKLENEQRYILC